MLKCEVLTSFGRNLIAKQRCKTYSRKQQRQNLIKNEVSQKEIYEQELFIVSV